MPWITIKQYCELTGSKERTVRYQASKKKLPAKKEIIDNKEQYLIFVEKLEENLAGNEGKESAKITGKKEVFEESIPEAEIVEDTGFKYELEVIKSSLATLENFASKIEASKNETIESKNEEITRLNDVISRQLSSIDQLNKIIETVSNDNKELRTQLAVRETELKIAEDKTKGLEEKSKQKETIWGFFNRKV